MATTGYGHYGIGPKQPTGWDHVQERRRLIRGLTRQFLDDAQAVRAGVAAAWTAQIDGLAKLSIQAGIDRVAAAAKVKSANTATMAAPAYVPPSKVYAGGATIYLDSDILTLADGTKIDIKTGAKLDVSA